jgi:putative holliday junction resolvase
MPEHGAPRRRARTLLAFDVGRRRIGVAVGQEDAGTAGPLPALRGDCPGPDWRAIDALVATWQPQLVLVGRPESLDGATTWMTEVAAAFAREIERRHNVAVELVDERLTTREARAQVAEQRAAGLRRRRAARGDVDSVAAQIVLRGWLEAQDAARRRARLG